MQRSQLRPRRSLGIALAIVACAEDPSRTDRGTGGPAPARNPDTGKGSLEAPGVQIVGRVDNRDPAGARLEWPGVRIIARFEGTAARVRLAEQSTTDGPSRFDVLVDGAATKEALSLSEGAKDYELVNGLAPGVHTVELHRLTEAQVGTTQFLGFEFAGGKLLPPPPAIARRLEFLGDSMSNGYGIDGAAPCSFSGATQNARQAYPALVAKTLDAEYTNLSYSGKGVLQNYTRSDPEVFGLLYPRALPTDASSTWDFPEAARPDVIFVNLGGNDWDKPSDEFDPPDVAAFAAKYGELLATIRGKHPAAHIIAALGPSQTDDHPEGFEAYTKGKEALRAAIASRVKAGDTRLYYFEPTRLTDAFRTGCDGHPNAAFHERLAAEIAAVIREKIGW